jgi:DNA helicase HerA-like ATPase
VLGRTGGDGPAAALGTYRAGDGSRGAPVALDVNRPHAALVVGKRGTGKSYTLGVLAEELLETPGVSPLVVDPMGAFGPLEAAGATLRKPRVPAGALPPRAWPDALGLDPESGPGALVWRAAEERDTLAGMRSFVADSGADADARRAAGNHLSLAASWGVFDPEGSAALSGGTVLDCAGLPKPAMNAALRAVANAVYERALDGGGPLPWVLVDEAHAFDGTAAPALRTLLTRGRSPGVSTVLATQRPAALPEAAVSQADLTLAHRLTSEADIDALAATRPTYLADPLAERLPTATGHAVVVDDATESVHPIAVRERDTRHAGESPRATTRAERHE